MSVSVKKAFRIIRLLAEEREPLNLTAVSRELKMNKATAFRYLETLEKLDVVEKGAGGYRLGLALYELGNRVPVKQSLIDRIDPLMRSLCADVNETVNLAQLHHDRALYLHKIESRRSLQMRSDTGSELPLHCTALGKAILAVLDLQKARVLIAAMKLKPHTPSTITSKTRLLEEIETVRRRGYSTDLEEFEIGLTCVAIPLALPWCDFFGAISISAPTLRMSAEKTRISAEKLLHIRSSILKTMKHE